MYKKSNSRVIAFYLPQFHPVKENNEWWGEGFTEWTNVGKAKPLFRDHYQPKVPADLGYYDLRLGHVREAQAKLAQEAGIEGFCYWHYWFGNGKRLLERPIEEILESGKPDFPFCFGWANESWQAKVWKSDESLNRMLIEQEYLGEADNIMHFNYVLRAFRDNRYIKVENKPIFMIYRPFKFDKIREFINQWRKLATDNGLEGLYFVAQANSISEYKELKDMGFDSITISPLFRIDYAYKSKPLLYKALHSFYRKITKRPLVIEYSKASQFFSDENIDLLEDVIPSIIPNWDHSPRSGLRATVLHRSTPELFRIHVKKVLDILKRKDKNKIVFLKSWNEWGEGNYMEPDLRFGKQYLEVLRDELLKDG